MTGYGGVGIRPSGPPVGRSKYTPSESRGHPDGRPKTLRVPVEFRVEGGWGEVEMCVFRGWGYGIGTRTGLVQQPAGPTFRDSVRVEEGRGGGGG